LRGRMHGSQAYTLRKSRRTLTWDQTGHSMRGGRGGRGATVGH